MKYYWNTTNNIPSNNNSITSKEEKTLSKKTKNTNSAPILKGKSTQKKSVKSNSNTNSIDVKLDLKVSPKNSPPETPKQSNELERKLAIADIIKPKKSSNTLNVRQVLPEEPKAVLPILSIQPKELPKQQEVLQPETSTVEVSKPQVVPVAPPPVVLQKKREPPVDLTSFFGHIRFESLMRKPKKRSNSPEPIHLQEHEKVLFRKILSDYEEEIIIRNRIFVEKQQQQQQQRSLHTSQTQNEEIKLGSNDKAPNDLMSKLIRLKSRSSLPGTLPSLSVKTTGGKPIEMSSIADEKATSPET